MDPYEFIKTQMSTNVPFANHIGVEVVSVSDACGVCRLKQTDVSINHLKTQHAGALFTLGEAASGAAMAGALAPVIANIRPIAANASIAFTHIAMGTITAQAKTSVAGSELLSQLKSDGKAQFDVLVNLKNESDTTVAEMVVSWHVRQN